MPSACLAEIGQTPTHEDESSANDKYGQMFKLRELHLLAVFILIYVGIEVTLGGTLTHRNSLRNADMYAPGQDGSSRMLSSYAAAARRLGTSPLDSSAVRRVHLE